MHEFKLILFTSYSPSNQKDKCNKKLEKMMKPKMMTHQDCYAYYENS